MNRRQRKKAKLKERESLKSLQRRLFRRFDWLGDIHSDTKRCICMFSVDSETEFSCAGKRRLLKYAYLNKPGLTTEEYLDRLRRAINLPTKDDERSRFYYHPKITRKILASGRFDGDIIITDPCYFIRDEVKWPEEGTPEYEEDVHYTYRFKEFGIHGISSTTLYGDWSCSVYEKHGKSGKLKNRIGQFCADAAMVAVADLDSVLKHNPDFDVEKYTKYAATVIRGFKGVVQIKYSKKYDGIIVEGKGNKKFIGLQTGF